MLETEWLKLAVNWGIPIALVAWLMVHLFSKMIPKFVQDFRDTLSAQQSAYDKAGEAQRLMFATQLESQRTTLVEQLNRQSEMFWAQFATQRETYLKLQQADREWHERRLEQLARSIQGLADLIVFHGTETTRTDDATLGPQASAEPPRPRDRPRGVEPERE